MINPLVFLIRTVCVERKLRSEGRVGFPIYQGMEMFKKQGGGEHPMSHFCKICDKRFVSGRALGGHMRAHATESVAADTELQNSKRPRASDHKSMDSSINSDLRGREFSSPKGLFGDSCAIQQIIPPEQFDSKKNNEEEDAVMCLVMLASGVNTAQNPRFQMVAEQTGSADLKVPNTGSQLPKCSRKRPKYKKIDGNADLYNDDQVEKTGYKCNSCNKVFQSHQALGGHRASHSKGRGYFSQITDGENESLEEKITDKEVTRGSDSFRKRRSKERTKDSCVKASDARRTPRIHKCSICDRVFPSGQALGGHKSFHSGSAAASDTVSTISSNKDTPTPQQQTPARVERFHWGSAAASDTVSTISSNKDNPTPQQQTLARVELFDLNLPAPVEDDCDSGNLNNLRGNTVDSHAQSHSPGNLQPRLMGSYLNTHLSKYDEADSKVGQEIEFRSGFQASQ